MGVFTETVVPIFGNLLATAMLLSPFPAVLRLRQSGKLGDTNPLPYPMTCINAIGWVVYGYTTSNPYIFPANILGLLAGLFFTLTAVPLANRKAQDQIAALLVVASGYFIVLGLIACFGLGPTAAARMWGTSAVVILMGYYVVPLSTMVAIVRSRNAASIYAPLAATAIANGLLWSIYGFAVGDINLWLPNLFGSVIGALQLVLRFVYGVLPTGDAAAGGDTAAAAARGDEEAAAAFARVHKASEAPQVGVEERLDSSSNLLIPGLEISCQGGGQSGAGGSASTANCESSRASSSAAAAAAAAASPPPLDSGQQQHRAAPAGAAL
ncbi:hypothetical protein PLESTB_000741500 [Pleodorina starrii]|uniref:Bidirectional sugar transporter SWEET n=1 Tax=Pleodorina starrii TaxID=330485 RepID=A0A9W6BL52_9CHLO|nr:hypothetical protein PLESTM_000183300 [Pleodorina starrii]GLC53406.1 hypothetical protein PLESTB_000741500 [Pleodorina starrii]GLC69731.1 hypothetical protein PLESTF_000873700 [Pleodorina starrii]